MKAENTKVQKCTRLYHFSWEKHSPSVYITPLEKGNTLLLLVVYHVSRYMAILFYLQLSIFLSLLSCSVFTSTYFAHSVRSLSIFKFFLLKVKG